MNAKIKNKNLWLRMLLLSVVLSALTVFYVIKSTLYPTLECCIDYIYMYWVIAAEYLLALFILHRLNKKSHKAATRIIAAILIIAAVLWQGITFMFSPLISTTNDAKNYRIFDECCCLVNNDYIALLPSEIPANAENIVYDYFCETSLFSGTYVYAEWTLPEEAYAKEKQRISDSLNGTDTLPFTTAEKTAYMEKNPENTDLIIAFTDAECKVSYYFEDGVVIDCPWKEDII